MKKEVAERFGKNTTDRIKRRIVDVNAIRTGKLLRSINYTYIDLSGGFDLEFTMIEYGVYVDEGTSRIQPRHFFAKVIEQESNKLEMDLEDEIEKFIYNNIG